MSMNESLREKLLADAAEASIPDWVYEQVTCAGCGCVVPHDEAEREDHMWFCVNCGPEYRLLKAISK